MCTPKIVKHTLQSRNLKDRRTYRLECRHIARALTKYDSGGASQVKGSAAPGVRCHSSIVEIFALFNRVAWSLLKG